MVIYSKNLPVTVRLYLFEPNTTEQTITHLGLCAGHGVSHNATHNSAVEAVWAAAAVATAESHIIHARLYGRFREIRDASEKQRETRTPNCRLQSARHPHHHATPLCIVYTDRKMCAQSSARMCWRQVGFILPLLLFLLLCCRSHLTKLIRGVTRQRLVASICEYASCPAGTSAPTCSQNSYTHTTPLFTVVGITT